MLMQAWAARNKICPQTMSLPEAERSKCMVHACFAWNWGDDVPDKTVIDSLNKDKLAGFCGIAGKPVCKAMMSKGV